VSAGAVRLRLPVVFCHGCHSQVLTTDAIGRWTAPTFLGAVFDARTLLCVHCARRVPDPSVLVPVHLSMASWVPGCGEPLSEVECFDFLSELGAVQVDETDARTTGDVGGGLW
jgi:hypothetical protein